MNVDSGKQSVICPHCGGRGTIIVLTHQRRGYALESIDVDLCEDTGSALISAVNLGLEDDRYWKLTREYEYFCRKCDETVNVTEIR